MRLISVVLAILCSICFSCHIQETKNKDPKAANPSIESTHVVKPALQKYSTVQLHGTEVHQITSKMVKGMEYKIYISLPENYYSSTETYPVLYFLDAWAQFGIIRQTYWLLRFYDEVPPIIIVGIAYEGNAKDHVFYRARDYTPTKVNPETLGRLGDFTPISGGAPDFAQFLEKELFPIIEGEYKVNNSDRAIFGVSYGGLFGAYALFKHPNLFQRYFIGSPPIWWDNEILLEYEHEYAEDNDSLPAKVFVAIGEAENPASFNKLIDTLIIRDYNGLELTSTIFENESHMSVIPAAHSRALRVLYNSD